METTEFYRSQIGDTSVMNYAYTDMPGRLLMRDIYYFFVYSWALPLILSPMRLTPSGQFAELYPSWPNLFALVVQVVLTACQLLFLVVLPLAVLLPVWTAVGGVAAFLLVNWLVCRVLNGPDIVFHSHPKYAKARPEHAHEQWVFLNGVAVGEHWMQSNLDRLAITFGRPIMGIHNRTDGILFDIVECLIQRNFTYATADVRVCFKLLRDILYDPSKSKVVFILHSQGGIEGGLVLDWLLQELPQDLLAKLEVYTFGNAANHFNNPHRHAISEYLTQSRPFAAIKTFMTESVVASPAVSPAETRNGFIAGDDTRPASPTSRTVSAAKDRAIGHVEHYAHTTDFVALWGVLHFVRNKAGSPQIPRFLGRVFARSTGRGGHLLNQHYLDGMFPLKKDPSTGEYLGADEDNEFMEEPIHLGHEDEAMDKTREAFGVAYLGTLPIDASDAKPPVDVYNVADKNKAKKATKVKELSRLWSYRNGRSPPLEKPPSLVTENGVVRMATL
ncbi:hypothetical protein HIM_03498 [Hirsutella minnesotensis 3608]|uniref:DUF676 domain-containing protein n=1 Tax=Hirsutella minnesotensis 3608 TaxID=1043627 RepID=A0A0F8A2R1_9HYPO|nr:hypothetical protein HIM_03498 [Hirsutella minnesotensis 3608]